MFNSVFSVLQRGCSPGLEHCAVLVTFLIFVSQYKSETRERIFIVARDWAIGHYDREGMLENHRRGRGWSWIAGAWSGGWRTGKAHKYNPYTPPVPHLLLDPTFWSFYNFPKHQLAGGRGEQVFQHLSQWGTFPIQITQHSPPSWWATPTSWLGLVFDRRGSPKPLSRWCCFTKVG